MVLDGQDEVLERIAALLRPLPRVDPSAKARILVAVGAERERARTGATSRPTRRLRWAAAGVGLAAAAALAAFVVRTANPARGNADGSTEIARTQPALPASGAGAMLAGRAARDATLPQPVQLVLRAPSAHRVSVVGDFTAWDASRAEMTRDIDSGLWSVTLALRPGRHVYAFVVDDSIWVRDPRGPIAPDADFGRPGSVLLVGRP